MGSTNLVGRAVDRYDVGEQLGQGGFGAVYRARHRVLGTEVALKVLWPDRADDPRSVERFLQEARAAAAIGSPHIVGILDASRTDDGVVYIAMELLRGRDLAQELRARGTLPIDEAADIIGEILEGLAAAHESGVIHRDLKPGNIFLAEDENGRRAKLLDFGISKVLGAKALTAEGMVLGTPHYMAPEQLEGRRTLDHRADLFAVGCVFYELITSQVPIPGESYQVMLARVQGQRPPDIRTLAPQVSKPLADVIMRALAIDPDARWPSARAMQTALRQAMTTQTLQRRSRPSHSTVVLESTPPARASHTGSSSAALRSSAALSSSAGSSSNPALTASAVPSASPGVKAISLAGLTVLALLLAGGLGVLGVLGYRLSARPLDESTTIVATNPVPVVSDPEEPMPIAMPVRVAVPTTEPTPGQTEPTTEQPAPEPRPEPAGPATSLSFSNFAGSGSRSEIHALLARAVPDLRRCARDVPLHLVLSVMVSGPTVGTSIPHPNRRSDDREAARCAADVIRDAGPLRYGPVDNAVFEVEIDLAAN